MYDLEQVNDLFEKDGYVIFEGVFDAELVARLRTLCGKHLENIGVYEGEIEATSFLAYDELTNAIFSEKVNAIIGLLIPGTVVYYPNFVVRLNRYTDWHVDNFCLPSFHEDGRHLLSDNFRHVQCASYLQGNDEQKGGGLTLVPGSHKWYKDGVDPTVDSLLSNYGPEKIINTKPGDVILFDGRILHRGTSTIPQEDDRCGDNKYALFWSASIDSEEQITKLTTYLAGRSDYLRNMGLDEKTLASIQYMLDRYDDVVNINFPDSFSENTIENIELLNMKIATCT